jgi:hypothetical protein
MRLCVSCGMPMRGPEDFPLGDQSKDYCVHCARPDGTMQGYEERAKGMALFIVRTQGLDEGAALASAKALMSRMPAWANRP